MKNHIKQKYMSPWDTFPFGPTTAPSQQNGKADGSKIKPPRASYYSSLPSAIPISYAGQRRI